MIQNLGILFGGKSQEHEISLRSAKSVLSAINRNKFSVTLIGIDKEGFWHRSDASLTLAGGGQILEHCRDFFKDVDVVFPLLHGTFGEDGSIQGFLETLGIPYVGCSVLGSSLCFDKDLSKRVLRDANIPVADFFTVKKKPSFSEVVDKVQLPFFIKPASMGSSLGITKVAFFDQFEKGVREAFSYDKKIIFERAIEGRELECSVLGLDKPLASLPGEIICEGGVYTYKAKYEDDTTMFQLPANVSSQKTKEVQDMALEVFDLLCCEGMARVDFFIDKEEKLYVNEVNTIPGFTDISLYPKLWQLTGLSYSKLIETLIDLAIVRFQRKTL